MARMGMDGARSWGRVLGLATVALTIAACGGSDAGRSEMQTLLDDGQWSEIRARAEVLRDEGAQGAWLDFAEGMALLHENADKAAEPLFERAVAADSVQYAPRIAAALADLSRADHESGWGDRAVRRMAQAVTLDPSIDPGEQLDRVADYFFRFVKDYDRAYPLYLRLYRERPEPESKHVEWVYRYGNCLERLGFVGQAKAVYEEYIATWPNETKIMRYVQWRHMSILIDEAEAAWKQAAPDRALELLETALGPGWHVDLRQRARYLAGQIEESRGRLEEARGWYAAVVDGGGGSSAQIIEQARQRLDALGAMGVH